MTMQEALEKIKHELSTRDLSEIEEASIRLDTKDETDDTIILSIVDCEGKFSFDESSNGIDGKRLYIKELGHHTLLSALIDGADKWYIHLTYKFKH